MYRDTRFTVLKTRLSTKNDAKREMRRPHPRDKPNKIKASTWVQIEAPRRSIAPPKAEVGKWQQLPFWGL